MRFLIILMLICFLVPTSCYRPAPTQSFIDLQVLQGKWTSAESIQFNENWVLVNDTLMEGLGFSLRNGDTLFTERLKIFLTGEEVFYAAKVGSNKKYVNFKLETAKKDFWEFFNQEHDYPNIIQYKLINDTLLEATTMNIRRNKEKVFKLKRSQK